MILFIAVACALAKRKGCRIAPIFREWSLYPLYLTEAVFWIMQIAAWTGHYMFIPYAEWIQTAFTLVLLFPILKFRLYGTACIGCLFVAIGSWMNKLVMNANGGQMPVYPTLSRWTIYFRDGAIEEANDYLHCVMNSDTKLKFLADWVDCGFSILSLGDVLIHSFVLIVIYKTVIELNKRLSAS